MAERGVTNEGTPIYPVPCPPDCKISGPHRHWNYSPSMNFPDAICANCNDSGGLQKIKGCIRCLKCGFKEDCNGF